MLNEVSKIPIQPGKSHPAGRQLKLQMQITIDGFVAGPKGELDWMQWNWSDDIKKYVGGLTDSVDTFLLGRKMTDGFISHWTNVTSDPNNPKYNAARKFVDYPKVVFTKTLNESKWANTILAKGDIVKEVNKIKNQNIEKDLPTGQAGIIVYGGAGFVSSFIKNNLIDEYHLFVNPTAIGKGMDIFKTVERSSLKLADSKKFDCGIVLNYYKL
jgi:dihydrofolate reductase